MSEAALIVSDVTAFIDVATVDALQNGQSQVVKIPGFEILLCRVGETYLAVENRCTHQAASLEGGRIRSGMIACPVHGVMFDLKTGCGRGPLGKVPLKTFATQVTDGRVLVASTPNT